MRQRLARLTNKDCTLRAATTYTIFACITLMSAFAAFAVEVGALPEAEFAGTAVSTNVALAVGAAGRGGNGRRLYVDVSGQRRHGVLKGGFDEVVSKPGRGMRPACPQSRGTCDPLFSQDLNPLNSQP